MCKFNKCFSHIVEMTMPKMTTTHMYICRCMDSIADKTGATRITQVHVTYPYIIFLYVILIYTELSIVLHLRLTEKHIEYLRKV